MSSVYELTESEEINLGFNWIFKIIYCLFAFMSIKISIEDNIWGLRWFSIIWLLGASLNFKCTSTGFYKGFNFYFFSFYFKKHNRWEELPHLEIYSLWFTYGMLLNTGISYCFRCAFSNFDKLAELISHNTLIEEKTRQSFINYVNMRKQQSVIRKILPTILFFVVLYVIFWY